MTHNTRDRSLATTSFILPPIETYSSTEYGELQCEQSMVSLIHKAENKHISKDKIKTFLQHKGASNTIIDTAYSSYYQQNGLYEITFYQRPLGFCVIPGQRNKNAIISTIEDESIKSKGLSIASRIYQINGDYVEDIQYKQILKQMSQQKTPFSVIFKQVNCTLYIYTSTQYLHLSIYLSSISTE